MSSARRTPETFRFAIRVYYEDTDAGGVVYYANYLKYMERARTEWLSSLGYELSTLESVEGIVFVVHRVEIDYRIPAKLGEKIDATLTLAELNRASMSVEQDIVRGTELLTHARVALACVDRANWRPKRIPAPLHERLERLP
ncbi:MAG TPA: tol-pal system-associated acyl-CoA thioesterase [Casimicrobiaceae bacterium]|nr:tol-pal system-associated acyl-CoA thioesterase [Casimicrobiaceae bacterium]